MHRLHVRSGALLLASQMARGTEPGFEASGSISNKLHERDPTRRAPLLRRMRFLLFGLGVAFHVIIIASTCLALVSCDLENPTTTHFQGQPAMSCFAPHVDGCFPLPSDTFSPASSQYSTCSYHRTPFPGTKSWI